MEIVTVYTDGSCIPNPGKGGWACLCFLEENGEESSAIVTDCGHAQSSTNNRMELTAVIKGVELAYLVFGRNIKILVKTDSECTIKVLQKLYRKPKARARASQKANPDLWEEYQKVRGNTEVTFEWVKAHAINHYNNMVDKLARDSASSIL